jgi:hypothetical protein
MATPDTLRDTKIPFNNGSGAIPVVGFGMLIRDPLVPKKRARPHWKWDFDISTVPNATAMREQSVMRWRRRSAPGRFDGRMFSSARSYGTQIIVLRIGR